MGKIIMNGVPYASTYDNATSVKYDDTKSRLGVTNVQDAIDNIQDTTDKVILKQEETNNNLSQLSNPNLLINGDFQIWQRKESFTFSSQSKICYSADRWGIYNMPDQTIEINKVVNGLQFEVSDNANNLFQMLETPLEIGEEYILSAKVNGEIRILSIVGGTPIENEHLKYYQYAETYDCVQIKPNGITTVEWVKLEKGLIITPFVPKLYIEELIACQRYYYRYACWDNVVYSGAGGSLYFSIPQLLNMRTSRSIIPTFGSITLVADGLRTQFIVNKIRPFDRCEVIIECGNSTYLNRPIAVEIPEGYPIVIDAEIY